MGMCISIQQMYYFLSLIKAPFERLGDMILIYATDGTVAWIWNGVNYCTGAGIAS